MSGDAEQEYFSDGISEDITTDLSKISALEVIARNTAFQFKGHAVDVCDVARKLGVSHVLEGSVRKAANRVRITAQLIDGKSGGHIWADRYDRDLDDIFVIQDEISKAIVDALKVKLLPQERKAIENRGTTNVDAYNLYLMARQYWITGNWGDVRQVEVVIRICKKAVEIDPGYAKAWGLLALLQSILRYTFGTTNDAGVAAAERALALDPTIAEAYCVTARHLFEAGEIQKSDEAITKALNLEPNSWEVNREAGRLFYLERRMNEAVRHYEKAVTIDETDFHTWGMLSSAYEALGNREGVLRAAKMMVSQSERVVASDPTNGAALGIGAGGLAILGERDRVKQWIDRALLISPDNQIMRYNFACISALYLHDPDGAIRLLEPIFETGLLILFKNAFTDPDLDSLRGDPRFERLLELARQRMLAAGDLPPSATIVT
jgi:adenylate cyclase